MPSHDDILLGKANLSSGSSVSYPGTRPAKETGTSSPDVPGRPEKPSSIAAKIERTEKSIQGALDTAHDYANYGIYKTVSIGGTQVSVDRLQQFNMRLAMDVNKLTNNQIYNTLKLAGKIPRIDKVVSKYVPEFLKIAKLGGRYLRMFGSLDSAIGNGLNVVARMFLRNKILERQEIHAKALSYDQVRLKEVNGVGIPTPQMQGIISGGDLDVFTKIVASTILGSTRKGSKMKGAYDPYKSGGGLLGQIKDALLNELPGPVEVSAIFDSNSFSKFNKTNPQGDPIMYTDRNKLTQVGQHQGGFPMGMELADNALWGVEIEPFDIGKFEAVLPKLPEPYKSMKWWPITSFSFSDKILKSRTFAIPGANIALPFGGERPTGLRFDVIEDAQRNFGYWAWAYVKRCYDWDTNCVLPYKDIAFKITCYQYDRTFTTMYKKTVLAVIADYTSSFIGASSHEADTVSFEFSIVGEIPN